MQKLNLPEYQFRFKETENGTEIFDEFRKKYIALTPEEWVRQNLLHYLNKSFGIPKGLIAVEKGLKVNNLSKRTDAVIYNQQGKAKMIIECKAPNVKLNQSTFEQIARYNMTLKVEYLLISNGLTHYCCSIDFKNGSFKFLEKFPNFKELNN